MKTTTGLRIDAYDDDGNVLPCRGELRGVRCGEPLYDGGECTACKTRCCEVCGLTFRAEDFDAAFGGCKGCAAECGETNEKGAA